MKGNIHFTELTSEHKAELQRGQKADMKSHQSLFMRVTVSPWVSSSVCLCLSLGNAGTHPSLQSNCKGALGLFLRQSHYGPCDSLACNDGSLLFDLHRHRRPNNFFFLRKRDPEGEKNHFTENDKMKRRWFIGAGSHADTQAQSQFHLLF